jgi:hypothetical protein
MGNTVRRGPPEASGSRGWRIAFVIATVVVSLFVFQRLTGDSTSDVAAVRATVLKAARSANPSYCDQLTTRRYLEQTTGSRGAGAIYTCRNATRRSLRPRRVDVFDIRVSDDRATALVSYVGGLFDGSTVRIQLQKQDATWKLDRRIRFTSFDRSAFERWYRNYLSRHLRFSPAEAGCVIARFDGLRARDLERVLLNDRPGILAIVIRCGRAPINKSLLAASPRSMRGCMGTVLAQRSDLQIAALFTDPAQFYAIQLRCDRGLLLDSYRRRLEQSDNDYPSDTVDCFISSLARLPNRALARTVVDYEKLEARIDACD